MSERRLEAFPTGLPTGSVSFVDRDWLTPVEGPVSSLSFAADGEVFWCGHHVAEITIATDPTRVAASALLNVAREAAAAVPRDLRGRVEVVGAGLIAAYARRLVASRRQGPGESPEAIIEATGDPVAIRSALERVSDLGTVVLVGEEAARKLDLDLYSTVHKRGLVLVGVAPPFHGVDARAVAEVDEEDRLWCAEALAEVPLASSLPSHALWCRIDAQGHK